MLKTALNITIIIFITIIFLTLATKTKAQELNTQKTYQDYQFQQSNYLNAETEYKDTLTFYKKNPTLQLREEARKKTLTLLKSRDQLLVVYLTALRTQLAETTGLSPDEKEVVFENLEMEVVWYQNHTLSYNDGDDLATLFSKSDESKTRYQKNTTTVIYNTLFNISLSQEIGLRLDHQNIYMDLKNFINDQVSQGKLKIDPFNRWINDTDTVLQNLNQTETTAKNKASSFYKSLSSLSTTYNSLVQILLGSVNPLKQLNNYLSEMLAYIQTQPL